jgi:hypothetical protein
VDPPASDQIEVSVFGPGYGECTVIHVGSGKWIIVDSCLDSTTKRPASLAYLERLGVPPSAVKLIVATHWHDDHIRGLAQVVSECREAKFCLSAALAKPEFIATIVAFDERHGMVSGSGVSEMSKTLELLRRCTRPATRCLANTRLLHISTGQLAHGYACEVVALAPSSSQFELSLRDIGNLVPIVNVTKHRATEQHPNHLSVVAWVAIGELAVLMGADLEEQAETDLGWSAILGMADRPVGKASVFKIPHHGSRTAHHPAVWTDLLVGDPIGVLTPWNKGAGLPTEDDVQRINASTSAAFSTSDLLGRSVRRRSVAVEKQIRETVGKLGASQPRTGQVRLRNKGRQNMRLWCVELFQGACALGDLF